mmetsp:Transcript_23711/g.69859  ORF Transcript_23711/g.69859 Transcript_23711/m.69859 type:complete len:248 (-) Transcript_23711:149-892(-)
MPRTIVSYELATGENLTCRCQADGSVSRRRQSRPRDDRTSLHGTASVPRYGTSRNYSGCKGAELSGDPWRRCASGTCMTADGSHEVARASPALGQLKVCRGASASRPFKARLSSLFSGSASHPPLGPASRWPIARPCQSLRKRCRESASHRGTPRSHTYPPRSSSRLDAVQRPCRSYSPRYQCLHTWYTCAVPRGWSMRRPSAGEWPIRAAAHAAPAGFSQTRWAAALACFASGSPRPMPCAGGRAE